MFWCPGCSSKHFFSLFVFDTSSSFQTCAGEFSFGRLLRHSVHKQGGSTCDGRSDRRRSTEGVCPNGPGYSWVLSASSTRTLTHCVAGQEDETKMWRSSGAFFPPSSSSIKNRPGSSVWNFISVRWERILAVGTLHGYNIHLSISTMESMKRLLKNFYPGQKGRLHENGFFWNYTFSKKSSKKIVFAWSRLQKISRLHGDAGNELAA